MITNFQIFENNNEQPRVDDYVCVNVDINNIKIAKFINNNVGKIVKKTTGYEKYFNVEWENVPKDFMLSDGYFEDTRRKNGRYVHKNEIKYYSKNKEDVETYIASLKYNI